MKIGRFWNNIANQVVFIFCFLVKFSVVCFVVKGLFYIVMLVVAL